MRALPQSLIDRAELLARSHQLQEVAAILGLHPSQISEMKKRGWKEGITGRKVRPVPSDFAFMSNRMSHAELVVHYRAGWRTVQRWFRETRNARPSRRGECLRRDPATGKRVWQLRKEAT